MQAPAGSNAEEFPDIVDLFRHYDALYFQVGMSMYPNRGVS